MKETDRHRFTGTILARIVVPVFALSLAVSCAYYNIFWTAKSEYERTLEASQYDFYDPFTQGKVTGEPSKLAESCTERCGKLLLLYPKSKWVDDALLVMGNCFLIREDYANAGRKYDELIRLYSSSELVDDAKYMKAYTMIREGSTGQAAAYLEGLLGETQSKEIRERTTYLLARVFHEDGDCETASEYFSSYLERYPKGRRNEKVRLHLADCMLKLGKADEVIDILNPLAERVDPDGVRASLRMGKAYRLLGQHEAAINIFEGITETAIEDSSKARAGMAIAQSLLDQGRTEEAIAALSEASEIVKAGAPNVYAEAVYSKATIYERRLQDFQTATTTYEEISRSPSEHGKLASKRAKALRSLEQYQQALTDSIPDSPEDEAKSRFLMAETYLEDLGLRDRAFEQYKTVADSLGQGEFGARAMLRTASLLEADGDTLALDYYRRVLGRFPNTVFANYARASLGLELLDVVIQVPDTTSAADTTGDASLTPTEGAAGDTLATELTTPALADSGGVRRPRPGQPASSDSVASRRRRHLRPSGGPPSQPAVPDTSGAAPAEDRDTPGPGPAVEDTTRGDVEPPMEESSQDSTHVPAPEDTLGRPQTGGDAQ